MPIWVSWSSQIHRISSHNSSIMLQVVSAQVPTNENLLDSNYSYMQKTTYNHILYKKSLQ